MLLLAACIENDLHKPQDAVVTEDSGGGPSTTGGDSSGSSDSGSTTEDLDCDVEVPADGKVTTFEECQGSETSPSWELSIKTEMPLTHQGCEVHASRAEDVNGDGAITVADPMQLWVGDGFEWISMFDADGTWRIDHAVGALTATATVGDADPTADGSEVVVGWYEEDGESWLTVGDEYEGRYGLVVPESTEYPWLADLEGDGTPEVVVGGRVFDATTGALRFELEGLNNANSNPAISADLDGDGLQEVIAGRSTTPDVRIFESDGSLRATCHSTNVRWGYTAFAVGNLDADPSGEIVAAGDGFVVVCDSDGTVLQEADVGTIQPPIVAIAELDGDEEPEILISEFASLIALESDLSEKWTYTAGTRGAAWYSLSVADLDNDGLHEVLVHIDQNLVILGPDGESRASLQLGRTGSSCWTSQPVLADIDADGLAEIIVADTSVNVITNDDGGWTLPEAEMPWPGNDRFPGDRHADGALPPAEAWWLDEGRNVWQGLPAGVVSYADLGVEIEDVCVGDCVGQAVVTIEVVNQGAVDVESLITVEVWSIAGNELLGSNTLAPPLEPGVSRAVLVEIPAERVNEGLWARVYSGDAECGVVANDDEWRDTLCP